MFVCLIWYFKKILNFVDLFIILNVDFVEFVIGVGLDEIIFFCMKLVVGIIFWFVGVCFLGRWVRGLGGELYINVGVLVGSWG